MKLNDRCHVVTTDGEVFNAWFCKALDNGQVLIELDTNDMAEIVVPRAKLRAKHHSNG
jgi:hypothetical protein